MSQPLGSVHRALLGAGIGALVAFVVLGPALTPGFLLGYDMVFVPHLSFSDRTLGIDGAVPRAVPNDALVAALSVLLPGWIVQKLLLVSVFLLWGAGVGLVLDRPTTIAVATVFGTWNPWVAQRLEIGHWGYLLAWGLLPWIVWAVHRISRGARFGPGVLLLVMTAISVTGSTGAVLGLLLASSCLVTLERGKVFLVSAVWGVTVALSATWWWPFLNSSATAQADANGVLAFGARDDTGLGVIASALSGGGIWNQAAWFTERQHAVMGSLALVLALTGVVFLVRADRSRGPWLGVLLAGTTGLLLGVAASLPVLRELLLWTVTNVPGGGLLRDGHKFIALWQLAVVLGFAIGAGQLVEKVRGATGAAVLPWVVLPLFLPVVLLPGLAWGSGGDWKSVDYPADTLWLAERLEEAEPGDVVVLPWTQYRRHAWNGNRIMLDPWPRLLARDVVVNDSLPLRDVVVAGEDPRARAVGIALRDQTDVAAALRSTGVRHLLLLTDQPNLELAGEELAGAILVMRTPDVEWWDLGAGKEGVQEPVEPIAPTGWWIALGGLVAAVFLGFAMDRHEKQS